MTKIRSTFLTLGIYALLSSASAYAQTDAVATNEIAVLSSVNFQQMTETALNEGQNQAEANDVAGIHSVASKRQAKKAKFSQTGKASWYGPGFHGRKTASGERFNMNSLTAAHRTLPLHSYVKVTNLSNGREVVVKINDRGPFHGNRVLDLSKAAAHKLGFVHQGSANVKIEVVPKQTAI